MGKEKKQQLLLFPVFCLFTLLAFSELRPPYFRSLLMLTRLKKAGLFLFCQGAAQFFLFIFLFAAYKAALSPSFLKGLDMLSVEGLCIQNGWG